LGSSLSLIGTPPDEDGDGASSTTSVRVGKSTGGAGGLSLRGTRCLASSASALRSTSSGLSLMRVPRCSGAGGAGRAGGVDRITPIFVKAEPGTSLLFICVVAADDFDQALKARERRRPFLMQIHQQTIVSGARAVVAADEHRRFGSQTVAGAAVWHKGDG